MSNISFDNVWYLFLILPLVVLLSVPFLVTVNKENRNGHNIASLVCHLLIAVLVGFSAAGLRVTAVLTETEIYVVADVSYSANRNLQLVDGYVRNVVRAAPLNSRVGLVCFGKDHDLLAAAGEEIKSVTTSTADDSATNIAEALEYTATLFSPDVMKRVVLITDGNATNGEGSEDVRTAVENLHALDITLDAIYLDDNITEKDSEVQLDGVEFKKSTYLNHATTADVSIRASTACSAIVTLTRNGQAQGAKAVTLTAGYNVVNFDLYTEEAGVYDYEVAVNADADTSSYNNAYSFTQTVSGTVRVLLITGSEADAEAAERLYGEGAEIDRYVNDPDVPCTVEALIGYDEILLSNLDVRSLNNVTAFVESLDIAVSRYGKSLVTMGDTKIQNKSDLDLKDFEDMLPVRYGNSDQDPKLVAIVFDASRSMLINEKGMIARAAAAQLLDLLNDNDYVTLIKFAANVMVAQPPVPAIQKASILEEIDNINNMQGTLIGAGMQRAYEFIDGFGSFSEKQVMLLSDGMSYTGEVDDPVSVAENMLASGIHTSCINTNNATGEEGIRLLQDVAAAGGGNYYFIPSADKVQEIVLTQIADEMTDSVVKGTAHLNYEHMNDSVLAGISSLPTLSAYVYAKAKASANTVLTTDYVRESGATVKAPIYSYWNYGNGQVSVFTSSLGGDWVENWQEESGERFFRNVLTVNTPEERVDYPYTLNVEYDGSRCAAEITPATLNPDATLSVRVRFGETEVLREVIPFRATGYSFDFAAEELGRYEIAVNYSYGGNSYETQSYFNVSYAPEYDAFAVFDASEVHKIVAGQGVVSEDGNLVIENDPNKAETVTYSLVLPLLIVSIVLFLADIVIRKLKWADIKSLFGKSE